MHQMQGVWLIKLHFRAYFDIPIQLCICLHNNPLMQKFLCGTFVYIKICLLTISAFRYIHETFAMHGLYNCHFSLSSYV